MTTWQLLRCDRATATDQPGKLAVTLLRLSQMTPSPVSAVMTLLLRLLCQANITPGVTVGPRLKLMHGALGTVIHPATVIGADCVIYHGVTLGTRDGHSTEAPRLGDDVYVGTGACILGPCSIGSGARIGANAIVLGDVPAGATAVGVWKGLVADDALHTA